MQKEFNCLTGIIELNTSPESLRVKKDKGLDAWIMYTIFLAYIRKCKGLVKDSSNYRHCISDVKASTQMTNDRLNEIEKYLNDSDIVYLSDGKFYHMELCSYRDSLGEVRRKAIANRWAKAEAIEPKDQNKADELPISTSIYQRLNKIKMDGQHSINERDLLAIARMYPEDVLSYFIENLQAFKKSAIAISNKIPFCLGEWKLIDHLKHHWKNKLELKKELPAWVNVPEGVNTNSNQNNISGESPVKSESFILDTKQGKWKDVYPKWFFGIQFDWGKFADFLINGMAYDPRYLSIMFSEERTLQDWKDGFNEWFLGENPKARLGAVYKSRIAKGVNLDKYFEAYQELKASGTT